MVERYGNFVTYNPPVTGSTIILWVAPLALMILGVVIVLRRKSGSSSKSAVEAQPNLTQEQQKRLEELLKERE